MADMMYYLLMLMFAAAVFVKFYEIYQLQVSIKPSGRIVLSVTVTSPALSRTPGGAVSIPALVVFAGNQKESPSLEELQQIASDIGLLRDEENRFDSDLVNEFNQFIKDGDASENRRHQVPLEMARGHNLFVASINLDRALLHPTWTQHGVVVVAKSGTKKGKISQLPWNHKESQKLFSGVQSQFAT